MARLLVSVSGGYISADIRTNGPVLEEGLQHDKADAVMRCAVLMGLSALAEGGPWPHVALESMAGFMSRMDNAVRTESNDLTAPVRNNKLRRSGADGRRASLMLPADGRARPARRGPAALQSRR